MYRLPMEGRAAPENKLERRWKYGYVSGYSTASNDYKLFTEADKTIHVARSIQRVPPCDKWRPEVLEGLAAVPQDLSAQREPRARLDLPAAHQVEQPEVKKSRAAKRLVSSKKDFDTSMGGFGYTEGCPRCDHAVRYG